MTDNRASHSSERPLAFDRRGHDYRRGPAPVTLILSLVLLMGVGGGVFWLYRGGARAPGGAPEPVGAPVRDVRIAAPPQAPTPDPAAGLSIYTRDPNAAPSAPAFTAPPEQPGPRPGAVAPPAAGAAGPAGQPPVVQAGASAAPVAAAMAAPSGPVLYPVTPAPATPAAGRAKPASIDSLLADATAPAKPAARRAKIVTVAAPKSDSADDSATSPAPKPAVATASKAAPVKSAAKGGYMVQIGAFSSQDLADKSWIAAAGVAPGAMAGKGRKVAQVTKTDGAVLYRASITGFASRDEAQALCAKLAAAGKTCFVR